jgi:hypothetical protein
MLAAKLNVLLASPNHLRSAKDAALQAAKRTFCWELQEKVLLQMVADALVK